MLNKITSVTQLPLLHQCLISTYCMLSAGVRLISTYCMLSAWSEIKKAKPLASRAEEKAAGAALPGTRQGHPGLLSPVRPQVKQNRWIYNRESACPGPGPWWSLLSILGAQGFSNSSTGGLKLCFPSIQQPCVLLCATLECHPDPKSNRLPPGLPRQLTICRAACRLPSFAVSWDTWQA